MKIFLNLLISFLLIFNLELFAVENEEGIDTPQESIVIDKSTTVSSEKTSVIDEATQIKKRFFLQIGALENKSGDKFLLRKKNSALEFFIDDNTEIYLKEKAEFKTLEKGNYVVIKGPKNNNAILANSIYIYKDKKLYEDFNKISEINDKTKIQEAEGIVEDLGDNFGNIDEKLRPGIIDLDNHSKMLFSFDDTTYWVSVKKVNKSDLNLGDRIILYFDKRVSLRIKNIPFKIVINRIEHGY